MDGVSFKMTIKNEHFFHPCLYFSLIKLKFFLGGENEGVLRGKNAVIEVGISPTVGHFGKQERKNYPEDSLTPKTFGFL